MVKLTSIRYLLSLIALLSFSGTAFSQLIQDSVDLQPYDLMIEEDETEAVDSLFVADCKEDSLPPAHAVYGSSWDNYNVNPYRTSLVNMADTLPIDISGYTHPRRNVITSRFGFRKWKFHYGVDVRLAIGDSVQSAFDGRVRIAKRGKAYGNYVVVRHYNGLETTYAHLNKILVKVNDEVKSGDLVGWGGNTGRSTGPHLHFEMRYLGEAIDPTTIIDFATGQPYCDTLSLCADNFKYVKEIDQIRYWVVRSGDSLSKISSRTGVSVARLCSLNGISTKSVLRIGQRIRYT